MCSKEIDEIQCDLSPKDKDNLKTTQDLIDMQQFKAQAPKRASKFASYNLQLLDYDMQFIDQGSNSSTKVNKIGIDDYLIAETDKEQE